MKTSASGGLAIALLVVGFPAGAWADLSQTTTLPANTALNLDTGATASSGNDLLWNGSTITPQGKAKAYNLGGLGALGFNSYSKAVVQPLLIIATSAPIPASVLVVNDVFVALTNGGNPAKVLVTAVGGGSITLQFTTYESAGGGTGPPTITSVLNNSSRIPSGVPGAGIAPSSLIAIIGTSLADAGDATLHSSEGGGLPLTLNGASVAVLVNGVTTHPALYYATPEQIDAVLPAGTPVGNGTLTVTHGAASISTSIQVVASAFGITTYNSTGVAQHALSSTLITFTDSAQPGEIIILWGTGLGADPQDSDTTYTLSPHQINAGLQFYFGGTLVPAANIPYQGASVYPGVDVIALTIPASVQTGCFVSLAAVIGGALHQIVTLPIHAGGGVCIDPASGVNGNQIPASGSQTLKTGLVALIHTDSVNKNGVRTVTDSTDAAFEAYTGLTAGQQNPSPGGCTVIYPTPLDPFTITGLDPGTITLTGPGGLNVALGPQLGIKGAFFSLLTTGTIPAGGGSFTFKGSGGTDVGSFSTTLSLSPMMVWTNPSVAATSISRSQALTVTWTGGNPGTTMFISGTSTTPASGQTAGVTIGFTCVSLAEAGQFTVPSYILSALPAGSGGINVQNAIAQTFSASGLDLTTAEAAIDYSVFSTYQ